MYKDPIVEQIKLIKQKFVAGGVLTIGTSNKCDCQISLFDIYDIYNLKLRIENTLDHKVINCEDKSHWFNIRYEYTIAETELKTVQTAPNFDELVAKAEQKLKDRLRSFHGPTFKLGWYKDYAKLENPDPLIYKNDYKLSKAKIEEIIHNTIQRDFVFHIDWMNGGMCTINVKELRVPKVSDFLAKQAVANAVGKGESCGISLEQLSELPFVFVNTCGHIFGPIAANIRSCPTCRCAWNATRVEKAI